MSLPQEAVQHSIHGCRVKKLRFFLFLFFSCGNPYIHQTRSIAHNHLRHTSFVDDFSTIFSILWIKAYGRDMSDKHSMSRKCGELNDRRYVRQETDPDWTWPATTPHRIHCFHTTLWCVLCVVCCVLYVVCCVLCVVCCVSVCLSVWVSVCCVLRVVSVCVSCVWCVLCVVRYGMYLQWNVTKKDKNR